MADGEGQIAYGVLGPLEARLEGRPVPLGGRRQRALLAVLLLHGDEVVARGRLVDALWGEDPPARAANAIQVAVHGLRGAIGAERIERVGNGYRLRLEGDELDLRRFRELVARAGAQEPAEAAASLGEALALWRGPALADLAEDGGLAAAAAQLEELRLVALERRLEAELALGRHEPVAAELETLVAEQPFRERLRALRMLALYRAGRQADALEEYRRTRRLFVDELGIAPGPELQELEAAILRQDAALRAPFRPPRTNLPAPLQPLVGRGLELASVAALLRRADVRLVTLTGPGGTGKTRLAAEAARGLLDGFADGVAFVDLSPLRDPGTVAATVARALAVDPAAGEPVERALAAWLAERRTLLVVDNFEHVADAATLLTDLLAAAPRLKVLATSRSPLRLSAEHEYPVPPLGLPDPGAGHDPAALARSEAVALFVARAQAARPDFRLSAENGAAVAEICRSLDGLPLALELAAARIRHLTPAAMLRLLEGRLDLPGRGGARDVPVRQRTLHATIDWSHDLLEPEERRLLARLAVFAGGCTPAAAEAVCDADLGLLGALVDGSLLRVREDVDGEPRFLMLETVRRYGLERLAASGELDETARRHAEHFARLAEELAPRLLEVDGGAVLARLETEHGNLRAALAWARDAQAAEPGLRLVGALWRLWLVGGHLDEGRDWAEAILALDGGPTDLRAAALKSAGILAAETGRPARAREYAREALALARSLGDERGVLATLTVLGTAEQYLGDLDAAAACFAESGGVAERLGRREDVAVARVNLAVLALGRGEEGARELAAEALELTRELGRDDATGRILAVLGHDDLRHGRVDAAVARLREALSLACSLGYRLLIASCLYGLAAAAAARAEHERAARLLGAATAAWEPTGSPLAPDLARVTDQAAAAARAALGAEAFAAAHTAGRGLRLAELPAAVSET